MDDNKLITYGELCKLGHFIQFSGTYNTTEYTSEWKPNSNKVGTFAILMIAPDDARENLSAPMIIFGNTESEKRRAYVSVSGRTYTECDVVISFNWARPAFLLESITRIDNKANISVESYKHIGWMYVESET